MPPEDVLTTTPGTTDTSPTPTSDPSAEMTDRVQKDDKLEAQCNQLLTDLNIHTTVQDVQDQQANQTTRSTNRTGNKPCMFGKTLPQAGLAAATARAGCPAAFKTGPQPDQIRATVQRVHILSDAEALTSAVVTAIRAELRNTRNVLVDQTMTTYNTVTDAVANPWFPSAQKNLLEVAAGDLLALAEGRLDARTQAASKTRTGIDREGALETDNAKLKVKNKYLSGQELRPTDVILPGRAGKTKARTTQE